MHGANAYEIRLGEVLDKKWAYYFAPLSLTTDNAETVLSGVVDQAELFGVLLKIRDLGVRLVSVNPIAGE